MENDIKVINLLNKIANGEEPPKKIKTRGVIWEFDEKYNDYRHGDEWLFISGFELAKNSKTFLELDVKIVEDIEHYDMFDHFSGYSFNGTSPDLLVHLESNFEHINEELDYLIKAVNELKKGK